MIPLPDRVPDRYPQLQKGMIMRTGQPGNAMRDVRASSKDWRVTEGHSGNAKMFVAPDVSPVGTHAVEMAKGDRHWTDMDTKVSITDPDTLAKQAKIAADRREQESMTCGDPIRRDRPEHNMHVMSVDMTQRDHERYQAMIRAAREYYGYDSVG